MLLASWYSSVGGRFDLTEEPHKCCDAILGPFGPPCALRTAGERIAARGDKSAKKRAVIAVARNLAVPLLALWKTGADYRPLPLMQAA